MKVVLFSLNNTLIKGNIMNILGLRYRFYYDLNRLRTNLKNGLISQKRFVREKMRLLKGRRINEISKIVNTVSLIPKSKKVLNNLRNEGFRLGLISDDLDIVIRDIAERYKLDYVFCNKAEIKNGRFTGKIKLIKNIKDYANWKKEIVRDLKQDDGSKIITVGSENTDAPMLEEANFGIAFNGSKKVKYAADVVIEEPDMDKVLNSIVKGDF